MAKVVSFISSKGCLSRRCSRRAAQSSHEAAIIRPFPGERQFRMINTIAAHMATLSDAEAEKFLVFHFDVEWGRLTEQGISEQEIEKYVFTTARAVWSRLRRIRVGAA
jgi:hypothetical protein